MTTFQFVTWPVDRLIPCARNLRTHSDEQIAQVAASIKESGWTSPIVAGCDGVIIDGHARLAAARKLGMAKVPVFVLKHLTGAAARAGRAGAGRPTLRTCTTSSATAHYPPRSCAGPLIPERS